MTGRACIDPKPESLRKTVQRMALAGATLVDIAAATGRTLRHVRREAYRLTYDGVLTFKVPSGVSPRALPPSNLARPVQANPSNGSRWSESMRGHFAGQQAQRDRNWDKKPDADMLAQIAAFDRRLVKKCPTRWADGADISRPNLSNNAMIRVEAA